MNNTKAPQISTQSGNCYEIPINMDDEQFYNLIYEFVDLAKVKGLTIRQAQLLFDACKDYVLESPLNYYENEYTMPCWKPTIEEMKRIKSIPPSK